MPVRVPRDLVLPDPPPSELLRDGARAECAARRLAASKGMGERTRPPGHREVPARFALDDVLPGMCFVELVKCLPSLCAEQGGLWVKMTEAQKS